jgi:hypothetical protein
MLALTIASQRPDGIRSSRVPEGVRPRHSSWCPSHHGDTCGCTPRWAAIIRRVQRLVGGWLDEGFSPSKIRSIVNALRVLWRDFDLLTGSDPQLLADPTRGLRLPGGSGRLERIAGPAEARRLIDALEPADRALWATAIYAGLRHGELRALQVRDIDLERRRILCDGVGTSTRAKSTPRASAPSPSRPYQHHLSSVSSISRDISPLCGATTHPPP